MNRRGAGVESLTNNVNTEGVIINTKKQFGLHLSPIMFSLVSLLIIFVLSLLVWNVFADPRQGLWKYYPQPFGAILFWSILEVVFLAFMTELWPFHRLQQPVAGLVTLTTGTVFALITVGVLILGYGKLDPAFNPVGAGWTSTGMVVLMGFYFWGILATNMGHWPWLDLGLKQPWIGVAEFFMGFFLTFLGYIILIYPSLASWASVDRTIMPLPTAVGWFYSIIVSWLTTFLILENWPWNKLGSRAQTALGALVGNFFIGTGIYFLFLALLKKFLVPIEAQASLGAAITLWPAQLGVCINFWLIAWPNIFDNIPNQLGTLRNRISRFAITYGLGLLTFIIYTRWFAIRVLHEVEISKGFGGDPLTWVDLMIYVMLIFVVYFGSYGLIKNKK